MNLWRLLFYQQVAYEECWQEQNQRVFLGGITVSGAMESDIEHMQIVVDSIHFVITHHPDWYKKKKEDIYMNKKRSSSTDPICIYKKKRAKSRDDFDELEDRELSTYNFIMSISRRLLGEAMSDSLFFFFWFDREREENDSMRQWNGHLPYYHLSFFF